MSKRKPWEKLKIILNLIKMKIQPTKMCGLPLKPCLEGDL